MDCMRRISKGTAHFGVFSPEDLIAAKWAGVDVLITSEMRFNDGKYSPLKFRQKHKPNIYYS